MTTSPTQVTFGDPYAAAITLVTFSLLAIVVAGVTAVIYRWYFRSEVPEGVAILLGTAVVALYLNTASLGEVVGGTDAALLTAESVFFNVVALGVAAAVSPVGRYAGDRLAVDVFALTGVAELEGGIGTAVRSLGRYTVVTLPPAEEIADIDTYEPVSMEKKAELSEKTLFFPHKLSTEELRDRLVERVKTEYGVGYVDADLKEDGTLEYFAVGSRVTGIGPTLAPGAAAVAVSTDPPFSATAGDMVQVWRTEPESKRIATGELRGVSGNVATVALDESDAANLSVEGGYRLVTLPAEPQADREFASLLRNADETMATATVVDGSTLVGTAVGDVTAVVAAVHPANGSIQAIPPRAYTFAAGDTVYLVGRPDAIRRFEAAASKKAEKPPEASTGSGPSTEPDASTGSVPLTDSASTTVPTDSGTSDRSEHASDEGRTAGEDDAEDGRSSDDADGGGAQRS